MKIKIKIKKSEFKALAESGLLCQLRQCKHRRHDDLFLKLFPASDKSILHKSFSAQELIDFLKTRSEPKDNISEHLNPQVHP